MIFESGIGHTADTALEYLLAIMFIGYWILAYRNTAKGQPSFKRALIALAASVYIPFASIVNFVKNPRCK